MPLLSTSGAAAAKGFGFVNSRSAIGLLGRLAAQDFGVGRGVAATASNEIIVAGDVTTSSVASAHIAKFTFSGLQWQRVLTGGTTRFYKCKVASSGNVYAVGFTTNPGSNYGLVVKYNSSGTILWQRQIGYTSGSILLFGIDLDSSENVFVTGLSTFYGVQSAILVKYDSNGNVLFQRDCGGGSYSVTFDGSPAVASSGNIYCCGYVELAGYNYSPFIAKYNSSGALQWQYRITTGTFGLGVRVDSSENCYLVGIGTTNSFVIKLNSSGVIQWTRQLSSSTIRTVAIDSSDNIYVSGQGSSAGTTTAKFDTSGTLLFARQLVTDSGTGFDIATNGNSFFTNSYGARSVGSDQMFFGMFPNSGAGVGSYIVGNTGGTDIVLAYNSISLTSTTVSYATASTTYSDRSAGLTSSASSLTGSTPTYPSAVSVIYM